MVVLMSSLAVPDEEPFVFGAYASHVDEVVSPHLAVEAGLVTPSLCPEVDSDCPVLPSSGSLSSTR